MIFKKIKLTNFRQFKGTQEIVFSTNPEKMITLIDGNNGAGKTTLVQAFNWCLFGQDSFQIDNKKQVLNNEIFEGLDENDTSHSLVTITFEHEGIEYTVERKQATTKMNGSNRKEYPPSIKVMKKDPDGNSLPIDQVYITKIIPQQLSKYFFFDGERMKHLNDSKGSQQDLSTTITNLMGLDLLKVAAGHTEEIKKEFRKERDFKSNDSAVDLDEKIQKYSREIRKLRDLNAKMDANFNQNVFDSEKISNKLIGFDSIKDLENKRKQLETEKNSKEEIVERSRKEYFTNFWQHGHEYALLNIMKDVHKKLGESEIIDKGIDGIQSKAIDEIIEKGVCICGNCVDIDSKEYLSLLDLKRFLPPENLSGLVKSMHQQIENSETNYKNNYSKLKDVYADFALNTTKVNELSRTLEDIHTEIKKYGETYNAEIKVLEDKKQQLTNENINYLKDIGSNENKISIYDRKVKDLEREYSKLIQSTKKNEEIDDKIEICGLIRKKIEAIYKAKEVELRNKLEHSISSTLSQILHANRTVRIDDKYNFIAEDEFGNNDLSEGQKVVISFSYVKAIIEISREVNAGKDSFQNASTELPLVMDAPLATLDTIHRFNVCSVLPEFSKQIILFTTMSQLDEESENVLVPFIGSRYELDIIKDSAYTKIVASQEGRDVY